MTRTIVAALAVVAAGLSVAAAQSRDDATVSATWLGLSEKLAAQALAAEADQKTNAQTAPAAAPCKPPPLPLHTIEGLGGTLSVPSAYMCNCGPEGCQAPMPSASVTYLYIGGKKSLLAFVVSETFCKRVEVSYALDRLDIGNLRHVAWEASGGAWHTRDDLYMHNFNLRVMLVQENSFGQPWVPAVTAGAHFKYNTGIKSINHELGGALGGLGYRRNYGTDFTLSFSKTIAPSVFGRPVILSGTLRNSSASNIGLTGFADHCQFSFEGHVICLLTDWLALAYEFRQKDNPYHVAPGMVGKEGNWHGILVGILVNDRLTIAGGWARLGEVGNTQADGAWGVQIKYEF